MTPADADTVDVPRLAARYPFTDTARDVVERIDLDLAGVAEADGAVLERAQRRVAAALSRGHVGRPSTDAPVELLSYPVARVLVTLVDEPRASDVYARAEAATARDRLEDDVVADGGPSRGRLLDELGLADDVRPAGDGFEVAVGRFLQLAAGAPEWCLAERALADGWVPVDDVELPDVFERAAQSRVADGLPVDVGPSVRDTFADALDDLEDIVHVADVPESVGDLEPASFPPCVRDLLARARCGDDLDDRERFTLVAFVGATGADAATIVDLCGGAMDASAVEARLEAVRIHGDRLEYTPPSCAVMAAYGDCVAPDGRCETVDHPLSYLDEALRDGGVPA